jgi:zinc transport system substrate-binding protein
MRRNRINIVLLGILCLLHGGCSQKELDTGRLIVAVSIPPQAEFVERIGGERVRVLIMVPPGASPHTYEPTPNQIVELSEAALYVKVGSGIEFELSWFDKIVSVNRDMFVVDASEGIERGEGAVHPAGETDRVRTGHPYAGSELDPHIWVSPRNAMIMVENTCRGLIAVDQDHHDHYTRNRDSYIQELEALNESIERLFAEKTNRRFIVYHPSWGYLARDYGLEQIPIESEGKKPSARRIGHLVEQAKGNNIRVIFVAPQLNTRSAEVIAHEIGGTVVAIDPLARDYIENIRRVTTALGKAMK